MALRVVHELLSAHCREVPSMLCHKARLLNGTSADFLKNGSQIHTWKCQRLSGKDFSPGIWQFSAMFTRMCPSRAPGGPSCMQASRGLGGLLHWALQDTPSIKQMGTIRSSGTTPGSVGQQQLLSSLSRTSTLSAVGRALGQTAGLPLCVHICFYSMWLRTLDFRCLPRI